MIGIIKKNRSVFHWIFISAIFTALSLFSAGNALAFGQGGCDGECNNCHSINKSEAAAILNKLKVPDPKVLEIRMSPIKGLWEVSVDSDGKRGVFYVPFSKNYIVQGSIIEVSTGADKTGEQYRKLQEARKIDVSKISLKNALMMGGKDAKKKVIIFTDPECPFCQRLHEEMKKVVEMRKDIAFYIRLLPLKMHPDAYWKSKSIMCNKSLQMLDDNFAKKPIPRTECNTKEVDNTIKLAGKLGITGTPTIILPNGKMHSGTMSAEDLIQFIDGKKKN